jgi:outer membrane scaffolding protein for murein synthesis (MipA/OmpV family)
VKNWVMIAAVTAVGLLFALLAPSVRAGDVDFKFSGKPVYIQSDEVEDERKKDNWSGRLGIGLSIAPDFLGSASHTAATALDFKGSYKDLIFVENNKIGSILYRHRLLRAGIIGRASFGRRNDLIRPDLGGLKDVKEAFEVGIFAGTSLYKLFLSTEAYFDVSGVHGGATFEIEGGYTYEFSSKFTVTPILGAVWGSDKYMQTYFGVDTAASTSLEPYRASAGFYEYYAELAMEYRLSKKWLIKGSIRGSDLVGSAAVSPIVNSDNGSTDQLSAFFAVVWLF